MGWPGPHCECRGWDGHVAWRGCRWQGWTRPVRLLPGHGGWAASVVGEPVTASLSAAAATAGASAPGVGLVGGPRPGSLSTGGGGGWGGVRLALGERRLRLRVGVRRGRTQRSDRGLLGDLTSAGAWAGAGAGGRGVSVTMGLDGITAGCGGWGSVASACGLAGSAGPGSLSLEEASLGVVGGGRGWSEPNEPTASTGTSKYFWSCKHSTQTSPTLRMVSSMRPPRGRRETGGRLSHLWFRFAFAVYRFNMV